MLRSCGLRYGLNFIETTNQRKPLQTDIGFALFAKQAQRSHNGAMQLALDDVALFMRIVELGSLSAAARERNAPVSQVTRALARLESGCGVRLLNRSTHGLSLTDEGDTFVAHGRRLLDTSQELAADLSGKLAGPSGWCASVSARCWRR